MTRAELLDLAARVEAAQGADRELDLNVWRAVCPEAQDLEARGRLPLPWLWCVTASLDAALTLAPADWHVTVRGLNDSWHVELNTTWAPTAERPARTVTAFCGNEARARTAAALRARAEEISDAG